jgi:hypothetical protein
MVPLELLRLEGLEVIAPAEGLLDRDRAVTLEAVLLVLGGRWTFRAEEDLGACRLFWLLALDLLLFLGAASVKMGSANSIRAKVSVTKTILVFFRYFNVDIIHLLSSAIVSGRQAKLFARRPHPTPIFHASRYILCFCSIH